jgi:gluconokinase
MADAQDPALPAIVIVMGVSGSGKTTVAALLAGRLGWAFEDADAFHPPANVAKMHAGTPLTDADRQPWLAAIAAWIDDIRRRGGHGVVTCSALKRRYRDILIGDRSDVRLVYLKGDFELIRGRISARHGHFMPPSLLRSQFEALEEPGPDEAAIIADVAPKPDEIVAGIVRSLRAGRPDRP